MAKSPITKWTDPCGCIWRRECREITLARGLPKKVYSGWKISISCFVCRVKGARTRPDFPWLKPKWFKCTGCQVKMPVGYPHEQCTKCRQLELFPKEAKC